MEVSARHLDFVETGRAKPGREMLLRLAERLDIPLRERNLLPLAVSYAPIHPERHLERPEMGVARVVLREAFQARRSASAQIALTGVVCPSQPPIVGCCDDRLGPPRLPCSRDEAGPGCPPSPEVHHQGIRDAAQASRSTFMDQPNAHRE